MTNQRPAPRRPSAAVYRRRRLLALVLVVIVVVVIVLIMVRVAAGSGTGGAAAGEPVTATSGPAAGPTPSSSGVPVTGGPAETAATPASGAAGAPVAAPAETPAVTASTAAPAATPSAAAAANGSVACAAGNIVVKAITDSNSYSSGSAPMLSFSLANTGSTPCTINAGTSQQVYTITSGTEVYWKSTDCQTNPTDTPAMLAAGQTVTSTPFAWGRTRSSASTCDGTPVSVPAGGASYHLSVTVGGITSAGSAQFLLY